MKDYITVEEMIAHLKTKPPKARIMLFDTEQKIYRTTLAVSLMFTTTFAPCDKEGHYYFREIDMTGPVNGPIVEGVALRVLTAKEAADWSSAAAAVTDKIVLGKAA